MSMGIGAYANKVFEDSKTVIYKYGGYNLNGSRFCNENHLCDGSITILKSCFVEPEIHKKIKRMANGKKKLIIKKIPVSVEYDNMIETGVIKIENCSCCWHTTEDDKHIDVMALHILFNIFYKYQEEGKIPMDISYNV